MDVANRQLSIYSHIAREVKDSVSGYRDQQFNPRLCPYVVVVVELPQASEDDPQKR